jgi:hypothetical protein
MIIVGCIISYKEGTLIQGAIRSLFPTCKEVYVWEGACQKGAEQVKGWTDLGKWKNNRKVVYKEGTWKTDSEKRNDVLAAIQLKWLDDKRRKSQAVWIVVIDADEILVWGEYLQDWLSMAPDDQFCIPILRTETGIKQDKLSVTEGMVLQKKETLIDEIGIFADKAPTRCIRGDMIKQYVVGCYQIELNNGIVISIGHERAPRLPQQGEPHIHHRSYLRSKDRAGLRLNQGEELEWMLENKKDFGVKNDAA